VNTPPSRTPGVTAHQVLATLGYGDAIGNHAIGICRALRNAGYESDIFVETADWRLKHLTRDYRDLVNGSGPGNVLIHHYSIGSRASRLAYALPERMILVYHNITPSRYFVDIAPLFAKLCYMGRRELRAFIPRCDLALGASEFNRQELEAAGFPVTGVLPVVPGFDHLDRAPDRRIAARFDDDWTNLLFVGRVIPNKKIEDLVRFFEAYRRFFNPRARLLIVGSHAGFEQYYTMLQRFAGEIGARQVYFLGQVSDAELAAWYDVADVFLCASEHEGFCVPLVEAFHVGVPVVAYAAAAVPATMDGAGVLYDRKDPVEVAALIDQVVANGAFREAVLASQDAALSRLRARDLAGTLLGYVEQVLGSPRRPSYDDFWASAQRTRPFEELRAYRPSLYEP
jgi:glycosyltransferase involved in cell wall biosynthesis